MNNSKRRFSTFLIVSATMLLSFFVSDAILSALGHFIVLDRISVFILLAVVFVFGFVKACSSMKVSEVMLTMLLIVLLADGVGIIGFSILSANYLSAIFLIPLVIISFALIFFAIERRSHGKGEKTGKRIGKSLGLLVFSIVLLALIAFAIVYFHAERLITLPALQKLEKAESIDFRSIIGAFEVGFDLNRTILTIALAVAALAALVSSVRHKGKGYGTLTFLLGLFFIDGIGICYFAFATGDYLTGGFLVPLMLIAFGLVIGAIVSRVTGWKPDADLLGKAMLVFALLFLVVFMVGVGFYYVKSNTAPSEVLFDRDLPAPGVTTFGAEESLGKGSLVVPLVFLLVTALFLFIATKLSEYPFKHTDRTRHDVPWQILLAVEGYVSSFALIASGCSFFGVMGPVLIGIAVAYLVTNIRQRKHKRHNGSFMALFILFLLFYSAGGILVYSGHEVYVESTQIYVISAVLGIAVAVLICWALCFSLYREKNKETIKVIAILIAILALIALCLFGYYLRTNVPEPEEPAPIEIPVKDHKDDVSSGTDKKTETDTSVVETEANEEPKPEAVVDVDKTPEPECEVHEIPGVPEPVLPPKTVLVDTTDLVPPVPSVKVVDRTIIDFVPRIPSAPEMNVADNHLYDFVPIIPSAPQGLTAWGWTYENDWNSDWDDGWSEEDNYNDDDFWDDFFIVGVDELEMEDGLYYINVFINGDACGEWEINLVNGDPGLSAEYLAYYLDGQITDETWEMIFFEEEAPYIFLSHLEEIGITTLFDRNEYRINIDFGPDMMPIRTLSLNRGAVFFKSRPIADAMKIEPATFVMKSHYTLNFNIASLMEIDPIHNLSVDLSITNNMRIKDVYGSFGMYLNYLGGKFKFDFGSWSGYKDFRDLNLKLSFGNINGPNSIGLKLEHNLADATDKYKNVVTEIITLDKESEVIVFNENKEIYRRRLAAGNYKLEDFTIFTGANTIEIHIKPVDGSPEKVIKKDILYSTGLLMPGQYDYGLTVSFGKNKVLLNEDFTAPSGTLSIPWFNNQAFLYDFRNFTFSGYLSTGITPALSISVGLNFNNNPIKDHSFNPYGNLSCELTHMNRLGVSRYSLNIKDNMNTQTGKLNIPGVTGKFGHQVSFDNPYFSNINFSTSYASPEYINVDGRHTFTVSLGFGGRLGIIGWNLTSFADIITDKPEDSDYVVSLSTTLMASSRFSLSASMNVNGAFNAAPVVTGRITGNIRLGEMNVSASTDLEGMNASASGSFGKHSISVDGGIPEFSRYQNASLGGSYGYSGNLFGFGLNFNLFRDFKDASIRVNLTTSSMFADGLMAFGANIPSNFLMISQKGAIKGNEVSVASIGSSSSMVLPTAFGVSLYSGISPFSDNGFTIYSTSEDAFGSSTSYDVSLVSKDGMDGYVLKLYEDASYSISGIVVTPDGEPWINGSSPLYEITVNDEGVIVPAMSELYMFTDETGRFILNEMKPGLYSFDMDYNDSWIMVILDVSRPDDRDEGKVLIFEPEMIEREFSVEEPYSDYVTYVQTDALEGERFWAMLYPEM